MDQEDRKQFDNAFYNHQDTMKGIEELKAEQQTTQELLRDLGQHLLCQTLDAGMHEVTIGDKLNLRQCQDFSRVSDRCCAGMGAASYDVALHDAAGEVAAQLRVVRILRADHGKP